MVGKELLVFISNFKYFWQNNSWFEWYSQTCSNDRLWKTTTRLRRPILSLTQHIFIQSLLYKTTTCLTRPATTFFCLPNQNKTCLKQPIQNITLWGNRKQQLGNVFKIIKDFKKLYNNLFIFSLKAREAFFGIHSIIYGGAFFAKNLKAKSC